MKFGVGIPEGNHQRGDGPINVTCNSHMDYSVYLHITITFKNDVTSHAVLLVHNLGGLSELELGVVTEVGRALGNPGSRSHQ